MVLGTCCGMHFGCVSFNPLFQLRHFFFLGGGVGGWSTGTRRYFFWSSLVFAEDLLNYERIWFVHKHKALGAAGFVLHLGPEAAILHKLCV